MLKRSFNMLNSNDFTFGEKAFKNLDAILSVPNFGIYIGPADMSSSYGLPPKFDVREDPVFSNIKMIAKKAREKGKIAGIHNGSVKYMKEMMEIYFNLPPYYLILE